LTKAALLGEPGDQIWYVFNVVAPYFLVAMAGTYLGVAAGAFEDARLHVTQRRYAHDGATTCTCRPMRRSGRSGHLPPMAC
jgi:alkylation response protein AidB-like acyl-CoA dehydrogenase